jgi:hypothetical protein
MHDTHEIDADCPCPVIKRRHPRWSRGTDTSIVEENGTFSKRPIGNIG